MKSLMLAVMALPSLALADVDPAFAKLRDQAEAMGAISAFVEKYVGDCASKVLGGGECEQNAKVFREGSNGKKFYMIITEETSQVLGMGAGTGNGNFELLLTPFFPASDMAITHGQPSGLDGNGMPKMSYITMPAALPEGWNIPMMTRQVQGQALRLQIVFTPEGVWSLPKKGGGTLKGVKARFEAVLVSVGRTGEQVALWFPKGGKKR